ncbi:MAG: 2OG-Fe(II) oxygenase [Chitinophagaceae bacterium]
MRSDHPTSGGVHILDNFIEEDTAQLIEQIITNQPQVVLTELTDDGVNYYSATRDENGNEYTQPSLLIKTTDELHQLISPYIEKIQKQIEFIWDRSVGLENGFNICGYRKGERLRIHYDALKPDLATPAGYESRDISSVLYLNSGFTGGLLRFPNLGISVSPKRGMLALFPSSEKYSHDVTAVDSGVRFFITQFWCLQ